MSDNVRQLHGRRKIYTSLPVTIENIPTIINKACELHAQNAEEIEYLINYYKSQQPILQREKNVRSDINNKIVINHAWEAVRNITGYFMGTAVQYVLKDTSKMEELKVLNDCMDFENREKVDKEVEDLASICGIGYKCTIYDAKPENEVPYRIMALSPLTTFLVYSVEFGNPVALSCNMFTYLDENNNSRTRYTVYTDTHSYILEAPQGAALTSDSFIQGGMPHFLNRNPIVAYPNNAWLIGDFEPALTIMDAINNLASNGMDDIEQVVQAILLLFGIPAEEHESLQDLSNGDVLCFSGQQGITQDGKYIVASLDAESTESLRTYLEETFRCVVGIPDRKTRGGGGGDTGDAVKLRDGWADMELVARGKEMFWKESERKSLGLALAILHNNNIVPNLNVIDIAIECPRNKNDNLQSKAQAGATLYGMGVAKQDVATAMNLTTDVPEFVRRWEESEAEKAEREKPVEAPNPSSDEENGDAEEDIDEGEKNAEIEE